MKRSALGPFRFHVFSLFFMTSKMKIFSEDRSVSGLMAWTSRPRVAHGLGLQKVYHFLAGMHPHPRLLSTQVAFLQLSRHVLLTVRTSVAPEEKLANSYCSACTVSLPPSPTAGT